MEAIQWTQQPVIAGIDANLARHQNYTQGCGQLLESLGEVAFELAAGGGDDDLEKVEQLRGAVKQVLEARHLSELHAAALQELKGSYAASEAVTDFKAAVSQRAEAMAAAAPYNAEADPLFREFESMVGAEPSEGGQEEQLGDDDEVAVVGGAQLAPNHRCPISSKLLLDIEEPVQDATGVVYEKAAIVNYFRTLHPSKHGRDILMAGSTHQVTLAEIVPSEKIIKAKRMEARRQKLAARGGGGAAGGGDDGVLDV